LVVLKTGVVMAAILSPAQVILGDLHGLNTLEYQPAKIAATEGLWHTERGAALTLVGFPDEDQRVTHFAIEIPKAASLLLTHSVDGEVEGLDAFEGQHPPVAFVFWSFRVMVGVGLLMIFTSWWALVSIFKNGAPSNAVLRLLSAMTFAGWVATLAGWYVSEVGRQPWLINGVLRAADVVAPHSSSTVLGTLIAYGLLYLFLLVSYIGTLRHLATKPAASLRLLNSMQTDSPPPITAGGR
jgi:cytochrome d ubiquinol oxidase subunit I